MSKINLQTDLKNLNTLTKIMHFRNMKKLDISKDYFPIFEPIIDVLRTPEILEDYFKKILNDKFCPYCHRIYKYTATINVCPECKIKLSSFDELVDNYQAIVELFYYFISSPNKVHKDLNEKLDEIHYTISKISKELNKLKGIRKTSSFEDLLKSKSKQVLSKEKEEHIKELEKQKDFYRSENKEYLDIIDFLETSSFDEFIKRSTFSHIAFNIRSIESQVDLKYATLQKDRVDERIIKYWLGKSQPISKVLSTYYPFGIVETDQFKYVVIKVQEDKIKKALVTEIQNNTKLRNRKYCENCIKFYEGIDKCTKCGNELLELYPFSPKSVFLHSTSLSLIIYSDEDRRFLTPVEIYPKKDPIKTYSRTESFVNQESVKKISTMIISDEEDKTQVKIHLVNLNIISFIDNFQITYRNAIDRRQRAFKICDSCATIWDLYNNSCPKSPEQHKKSKYVRIINTIKTNGILIELVSAHQDRDKENIEHTIGHLIKTSLQKIAGVDIREISEVEDENCAFYIYDNAPGGIGICESLFKKEKDRYIHMEESINIMKTIVNDCQCEDGCPICIYQFNCNHRNDPNHFNKKETQAILNKILVDNIKVLKPDEA